MNRLEIKKIDKYNFIKMGMILFIMIAIVIRALNSKMPASTTDEFGYLYHAAKWSGWDWKQLVEYYPYYGAGMGILWFPLFKMLSSPTVLYQAIVLLNGVFLSISFLVSLKCSENLFPLWNRYLRLLACFVIVFYPSNMFYARLALSETVLYLLFWVNVLCLIKLLQTEDVRWGIFLGGICGFMLIVHLRTAGYIIALLLFLTYLFLTKTISWKHIVPIFMLIVAGFVGFLLIKNGHYDNIGGLNQANIQNTEISIAGMMEVILLNLRTSIEGSAGHVLYYLIAGGLCGLCGMKMLIEKTCFKITSMLNKRRCKDKFLDIYCFLLFAIAINFVAFYVRPHVTLSKYDVAMYGRYMENFMGPVLLCGLYYITTQGKKAMENIYLYIFLIAGCTPFVTRIMNSAYEPIFAMDSAVGVGGFFLFDMSGFSVQFKIIKMICIVILFVLGHWGIYKMLKIINKERLFIICTVLFVGSYWGYLDITSEINFDMKRDALYTEYTEMSSLIKDNNAEDIIFIQDTPDSRNNIKYLQYLLRDRVIEVENSDYIDSFPEQGKKVFLCDSREELVGLEKRGYTLFTFSKLNLYLGE